MRTLSGGQVKIIKQASMRGNDNCRSIDTFLSPADETVAFTTVDTTLVGAPRALISRWYTLDTGRDTLPGRNFLRQHGQFTAFTCYSLPGPES